MSMVCEHILSLYPGERTQGVTSILKNLIKEALQEFGEEALSNKVSQFTEFFRKMSNPKKISSLHDKNHRMLVIQLIKAGEISLYSPSYLNRAKITGDTLKLLKEVGPYLFTQGIVIVSKMNIIHKHFSRRIIEDKLYNENESIIDQKISEILKTCTERKRTINKNSKKLQILFEDSNIRVQLVKQLGKLLRDAWKQDKIIKSTQTPLQENMELERVKPLLNYEWDIDNLDVFGQDFDRRSLSSIDLISFSSQKLNQSMDELWDGDLLN